METRKAKKVIIVTEASIQQEVINMLTELGAGGYTILPAAGKGRRGVRLRYSLLDESSGNVRVEVIDREEVVKKIAHEMAKRFSKTHACIIYLQDAEVIEIGEF
jgi:nitrogen regulatory protein PII